jgi:hypothetical protein
VAAVSEESQKTATAPKTGGQAAKERMQRFNEVADRLRQRADVTAKTLGALGTTVVTAVGISKFSDIFPLPEGAQWIAGAVIFGFVLMASAVAAFSYRLWRVNEPIFWRSDLDLVTDLWGGERESVEPIYEEMGRLNETGTLRAYEARADRLERISKRISDSEWITELKDRADEIRGEVSSTHARANLRVVRRRLSKALTGFWARVFYGFFVVGVLLFGIGADYLQSERSDRIALAKNCAEARTAKALESQLPSICGQAPTTEEKQKASTEHQTANAAEQLAVALSTCQGILDEDPSSDPKSCDPIRRAILTLMSEP